MQTFRTVAYRRSLKIGSSAALLLLAACTIRVTPPTGLRDPQTVFIADYGIHASLLIPRRDGRIVEYAYGEWEWFALGHDQWYRAGPALLWPTRGTLGRADFEGPAELDAVRRQLTTEEVYELQVERSAAAALLKRLDASFANGGDESVYNDELKMKFVPHPASYSLHRECNSVVADWLRELDCAVAGCAMSANFVVREAASEPPAQAEAARRSFFSAAPRAQADTLRHSSSQSPATRR